MNSDRDKIDEEIEMEICDTHKTSGKNREDTTNTYQSVQIKHISVASKNIKSKGKSCQDEEMPHIQANRGKGVAMDDTVQIPMKKN